MDNISVEDELVVIFASALLYGVYLCSLAYCLRWLLFAHDEWRTQWKRNRTTIVIVLAIFILTTSYVSLGLFKSRTLVYNTVNKLRSSPPGIQPWYSVAIRSYEPYLILNIFQIYRCWLVYGRLKRVIIFPCIMWIGVNMTVGLGTVLTPFWATTILLNAYTMCMLMYRIWNVARTSVVPDNVQPFLFAFRILGESGFLYFATTITHFIVWWTPCNLAIRLASQMNIPTIGIAFNLLHIRVGQNRTRELRTEEKLKAETVSAICYATSRQSLMSVPPKNIVELPQQSQSTVTSSTEEV
ncbi:hypothetical protein BJ912DRAFT_970649 [Pholiota molesta]|nr:hypothetical protein BJ912DRAFT_970649 [Pholiota molesta]